MTTSNIELNGLTISDDLHLFLQEIMDHLEQIAPSSCYMHLSLSQTENYIVGELLIKSITDKFFTQAEGKSLPELIFKITADIERQLTQWKGRRHVLEFEKEAI